jgi:hypothetical protein
MTEYFVMTANGSIINCITSSSKEKAEEVMKKMIGGKKLHLETNPSLKALAE